MIPIRVALRGFMCYRDEQVLFFVGAPLWVLAGPNGAGKSTIFDAVTFALFGEHRAGRQQLGDLINHHCDRLEVAFDFSLDGHLYRVRRTRARRGGATFGAFRLLGVDPGGTEVVEPIPDTDSDRGLERWIGETIGLDCEAFTASVLLRQGESDKLLTEPPARRYKILAELIDLSRYQRLHQLVDTGRKEYESTARTLAGQLQVLPTISDEQLRAAEEAMTLAQQALADANEKVGQLTRLHTQAERWEQATCQLADLCQQRQQVHELLIQADEIEAGAARWQELEQVLPQVRGAIETRGRLAKLSEKAKTLVQELGSLEERLHSAEAAERSAASHLAQAREVVQRLTEDLSNVNQRLADVAPLISKLNELERDERDLWQLQEEIATYPADLDERIEAVEERVAALKATADALRRLPRIAAGRVALAHAVEAQQAGDRRVAELRDAIEELDGEISRREGELSQANGEERRLGDAVTEARTRYRDARERLRQFEQTAGQETCSLCGQRISPEHAEQEHTRLSTLANEAAEALAGTRRSHAEAQRRVQDLTDSLAGLKGRRADLIEQREEQRHALDRAMQEIEQRLEQLGTNYDDLPERYRYAVAGVLPGNPAEWLATTYPTADDLGGLRQDAAELPGQRRQLEDLQEQQRALTGLISQQNRLLARIQERKQELSREEAERARSEQSTLEERRKRLNEEVETAKEEQRTAEQAADERKVEAETLRDQHWDQESALGELRATITALGESLELSIAQLPEPWREPAQTATASDLSGWEAEQESLATYPEQARQLAGAHERLQGLEKQIAELKTTLEELPVKTRRPAAEIATELDDARRQRDNAQAALEQRTTELTTLRNQREQRCQLEEQHRQADRNGHLHRVLAELLGPGGLQLHLIRQAEGAIVAHANEILDRLSGGRMRLELRGRNGATGKALDLVFYDFGTGTREIAVGFASGSQRFRIAVSLALAIGRYLGQQSQRIQSVIIDEGFGSLDRTGRSDMIQVLSELQTELARIILVSHQDEIAEVFPNRYEVRLVNGASHVSLAPVG
jgi:DNA repair protein SbcC/Rad50